MKAGIVLKFQKVLVKNAPTILAVMGGIGTIAAVCMSSDAAIKAKHIREVEEFKNQNRELCDKYLPETIDPKDTFTDICNAMEQNGMSVEESKTLKYDESKSTLSKADTAYIYIKAYAPTAIMTVASLICIFGSNHISKKRIATLASAYLMSETALKEYKEKAKEVVGLKKAQEISDEVIQDRITKNPPNGSVANIDTPAMSNVVDLELWYDEVSDRYFYSSAEKIRKAELVAQKMLNKNGFVSINDVYAILGLRDIPIGNDIGWQKDRNCDVILLMGAALCDNDKVVGTLTMDVQPTNAWLGEV